MSLTSLLKAKNSKDLRNKLKTEFLRPSFKLKSLIKVPPFTNNNALVGTAFDYLMRFHLQFQNPKTFVERQNWIADYSFETLKNHLSKQKKREIAIGYKKDKIVNAKLLKTLIVKQYRETKNNYIKFIKDGQITNELAANALFLAKLDVFFRTGIIDNNFDFHDPKDIIDLKELIELVDNKQFLAEKKCYFNPTFGVGSSIVGGADADLIIDHTLIDIKTTKHLKLTRVDLNQILGYYVLSLIGGVNNKTGDKPIKNIGIYFARHGELWTIPLSHFGEKQKFLSFKRWFTKYLIGRESINSNRISFPRSHYNQPITRGLPKQKRMINQ